MPNWLPKILRNRFALIVVAAFVGSAPLAGFSSCRAEPKVIIRTMKGRSHEFVVEIADTPAKRQLGLQYRKALAQDRGMLFLFPTEQVQSFWMKDTPISLDMIFIDRSLTIVGIVHEATPFSLDSRSVSLPSQYVLEINGGLARKLDIERGDNVQFNQIPARETAK